MLVDDLEEDGGGGVGPHRTELPRRRPPDADLHVGDAGRVLLVGAVASADGAGDLERRTKKCRITTGVPMSHLSSTSRWGILHILLRSHKMYEI